MNFVSNVVGDFLGDRVKSPELSNVERESQEYIEKDNNFLIDGSSYKGTSKINNVIGSPVGVITADSMRININSSGRLSVKKLTLIIFLLRLS